MISSHLVRPRSTRRSATGIKAMGVALSISLTLLQFSWTVGDLLERHKTNQAMAQIFELVSNWRAAYAERAVDFSDGADLTAISVERDLAPQALRSDALGLRSPWGGGVSIYGYASRNAILVRFDRLTASQCLRLAAAIFPLGTIYEGVSGVSQWLYPNRQGNAAPWTTAQIKGLCEKSQSNSVEVMYLI